MNRALLAATAAVFALAGSHVSFGADKKTLAFVVNGASDFWKAAEAGVKKAAPIFKRAKGCKFMTLQRSHEMPQRYRLFVQWETLENHTKDFRESADFQEWRKLVGHCFSSPPSVEHVTEVMRGF